MPFSGSLSPVTSHYHCHYHTTCRTSTTSAAALSVSMQICSVWSGDDHNSYSWHSTICFTAVGQTLKIVVLLITIAVGQLVRVCKEVVLLWVLLLTAMTVLLALLLMVRHMIGL